MFGSGGILPIYNGEGCYAGQNAQGYGAGGSGAIGNDGSSYGSCPGGAGAGGLVLIEYSYVSRQI